MTTFSAAPSSTFEKPAPSQPQRFERGAVSRRIGLPLLYLLTCVVGAFIAVRYMLGGFADGVLGGAHEPGAATVAGIGLMLYVFIWMTMAFVFAANCVGGLAVAIFVAVRRPISQATMLIYGVLFGLLSPLTSAALTLGVISLARRGFDISFGMPVWPSWLLVFLMGVMLAKILLARQATPASSSITHPE